MLCTIQKKNNNKLHKNILSGNLSEGENYVELNVFAVNITGFTNIKYNLQNALGKIT